MDSPPESPLSNTAEAKEPLAKTPQASARHSIASDIPMGRRRPSFLCLKIPDRSETSSSVSASSSWRGSLTHLGLPLFTLTSPDGDTGRKFSFGLGLRRHSHNVSFECVFVDLPEKLARLIQAAIPD